MSGDVSATTSFTSDRSRNSKKDGKRKGSVVGRLVRKLSSKIRKNKESGKDKQPPPVEEIEVRREQSSESSNSTKETKKGTASNSTSSSTKEADPPTPPSLTQHSSEVDNDSKFIPQATPVTEKRLPPSPVSRPVSAVVATEEVIEIKKLPPSPILRPISAVSGIPEVESDQHTSEGDEEFEEIEEVEEFIGPQTPTGPPPGRPPGPVIKKSIYVECARRTAAASQLAIAESELFKPLSNETCKCRLCLRAQCEKLIHFATKHKT